MTHIENLKDRNGEDIKATIGRNKNSGSVAKTTHSMNTSSLNNYDMVPLAWVSGLGIVHKLKGHRFDSQSGKMPGLQPGPWLRAYERQLIDVYHTH